MKASGRSLIVLGWLVLTAVLPVFGQVIITHAGTGIAGFSGDGGPALFTALRDPLGMAFDSSGNLYFSDANNSLVRKITSGGVISTYAGGGASTYVSGAPATAIQLISPGGLAFDSGGNLYIADNGLNRVLKVTTSTGFITTFAGNGTGGYSGEGTATSVEVNQPYGLAFDTLGNNLYIADRFNNRVRKVTAGGIISTVAGTGAAGSTGDGGLATSALLNQPIAVLLDGSGNIYISDFNNNRVRKVDNSTGNINAFAGTGSCCFGGDGDSATSALLRNPIGLAFDVAGNLLIADYNNHRIRQVTIPGGIISTIAGNGTAGFSGDGGAATAAMLNNPQFIAVDTTVTPSVLYIGDQVSQRIRKVIPTPTATTTPVLTSVNPSSILAGTGNFTVTVTGSSFLPGDVVQWNGSPRSTTFVSSNILTATFLAADVTTGGTSFPVTVFNPVGAGATSTASVTFTIFSSPASSTSLITTYAGTGTGAYDGDGGQALFTAIYGPHGMVFDSSHNLYFADFNNNRVRKITPSGVISTVAGGGSVLGDGGPATFASLNNPVGVGLDNTTNSLYIADYNNNRIRKVASDGTITTVAGNGTAGFSGDGGPAASALVNHPYGLVVDAAGNVYFADRNNNRVRKISGGTITTVAGNAVAGFFGDGGPAIFSPLNSPLGVALDGAGNLYIGDYNNRRVRKVSAPLDGTGTISTVAGNGGCCFSGDGGPATSAMTRNPVGMIVDASGNLYFAEDSNNRVRKVDATGIISTVAGTGTAGFAGDGGLATSGQINNPVFVAIDSGNLYITDYSNNRIRKVAAPSSGNPVPTLTSMTPSRVEAGSEPSGFTLVVYGSNFVPGATVRWNGADRLTTFVSSNQLTATINNFDVATAGTTASVTVFNPATGGGTSSPLTFTIYATPAPSTSLIITAVGTGIGGYSGDGGLALFSTIQNPQGVVFDPSGNLYVADYSNNRVRKITTSGIISTFAGGGSSGLGDGGPANFAQLNQPIGLAFDPFGNLFIVDRGNNRIRKVNSAGIITTLAGTGAASFSGDGGAATGATLNNPIGVGTDSLGNVYIADQNNNRIRKVSVSDGSISTVAGNAFSGFFGDGGPAVSSPLNAPVAVIADGAFNLYIADQSNRRIRKVSAADGTISTIAGNGTCCFSGDGGPAIYASIRDPQGLALDSSGNLYFADVSNNRVRKVDAGGIITTVAGGSSGFSGDGGLATASQLSSPVFLALDPITGSLYVSDAGNNRVRRILAPPTGNPNPTLGSLSPAESVTGVATFTMIVRGANFVPGSTVLWNGVARSTTFVSGTQLSAVVHDFDVVSAGTATVTVQNPAPASGSGISGGLTFRILSPPTPSTAVAITSFGGSGIAGFSGDGGPALYATFNSPRGMAFDSVCSAPAGNLYVADTNNHRVRMISPTGIVTTVAGNGTAGFSGDGGPATVAQLNAPASVALDSACNLYISDNNNNRVRRVTTGGTISTYAGKAGAGFSGDGGQAINAQLNDPYGIAVDSTGVLFIADFNNQRIRRVGTDGTITTVAGNGIQGYFGDGGQAINSPLNGPIAVTTDAAGNLYISDMNNFRVRKVAIDGTITTIAGTGACCFSGDGGPAIYASLYYPRGLGFDTGGNLYIADTNNQRIRKLDPGGTLSTVAGTGSASFSGDGGLASGAGLRNPEFVIADAAGNVYIADTDNNRIRKVEAAPSANPVPTLSQLSPAGAIQGSLSSGTLTVFVKGANFVPGAVVRFNGSDLTTSFFSPNLLSAAVPFFDFLTVGTFPMTVFNPTLGGGGGVSASSLGFAVVPSPATPTAVINTTAGTGATSPLGDGGPATSATLAAPQTLIFDASGNLYVADCSNNRVRKIVPGGTITTIAGGGSTLGDGGAATSAKLSCPVGLAFDGPGNLYIADSNQHRVRKVTPGGTITTVAGNGTAGSSGDTGLATSAQLNTPWGVAVDGPGNLYIATYSDHRVRKVSAADGTISTFAGTGVSGFFGDGGPAVTSPLSNPAAVVLDAAGNLYISEQGTERIRRVNTDGTIMTVAGTGSCSSGGDGGAAIYAQVCNPAQIVFDSTGAFYFADQSNHRIRKVDALGIISTVAGTSSGFSGDGGAAVSAKLQAPFGVALDGSGNLFIADTNNNRIREVPSVTSTVCSYLLSAGSASFSSAATVGSVVLTTGSSCTWAVSGGAPFVTVTSASSGTGSTTVTYSVAANPSGASRSTSLTIAGLSYTVNQSGVACSFALSATSASYGAGTQSDSVNVTSGSGCAWTATSSVGFITVAAGSASGTGNGTVNFSVAANPTTSSRTGTIAIGGQVFTVTQAGVPCTYSLLGSTASYDYNSHTGSIGVSALAGCSWTAATPDTFISITSGATGTGSGTVNYLLAANSVAAPRSGSITVSGTSGLVYTINQAAFVGPAGSVTAGGSSATPGGTAHIPVTLALTSGSLDSLSFGLTVTPVGAAPALTTALAFSSDPALPAAKLVDTGSSLNSISVFWDVLSPPISGTVALGQVVVSIPASAAIGQSYTVHVTGANGTSATVSIGLSAGADATLLLSDTYLVGDAAPAPSAAGDLNGDGTFNEVGEFGDGTLNNFDLIAALRAVTSIPGARPPACSDRYDAMDASPKDTTARGGDGALDNFDLIVTLRRVTSLDTSRPTRGTRGLVCPDASPASLRTTPLPEVTDAAGALEFGAQQDGRVPVYLHAVKKLDLAGLSYSLGLTGGLTGDAKDAAVRFVSAYEKNPSLVDHDMPGKLALAWLDGVTIAEGDRVLLGYVQIERGDASIEIYGVVANAKDGSKVGISFPTPRAKAGEVR